MKFLCIECDAQMQFSERTLPGDGTLAVEFTCPVCGRSIAMLTNPMETQMVSSLGVKIGHETLTAQPFDLAGQFLEDPPEPSDPATPTWDEAAIQRLSAVPNFVRGMVKRIYNDYAKERNIDVITPAVMDKARNDLGLEGM